MTEADPSFSGSRQKEQGYSLEENRYVGPKAQIYKDSKLTSQTEHGISKSEDKKISDVHSPNLVPAPPYMSQNQNNHYINHPIYIPVQTDTTQNVEHFNIPSQLQNHQAIGGTYRSTVNYVNAHPQHIAKVNFLSQHQSFDYGVNRVPEHAVLQFRQPTYQPPPVAEITKLANSNFGFLPPMVESTFVDLKVCTVCGKRVNRDMSRHMRTHQPTGRFKCKFPKDKCSHRSGQFNRPYDFKKHLLNRHFKFDNPEAKKISNLNGKLNEYGICPCGMKFTGKDWLENHILTNTIDKKCILIEH